MCIGLSKTSTLRTQGAPSEGYGRLHVEKREPADEKYDSHKGRERLIKWKPRFHETKADEYYPIYFNMTPLSYCLRDLHPPAKVNEMLFIS